VLLGQLLWAHRLKLQPRGIKGGHPVSARRRVKGRKSFPAGWEISWAPLVHDVGGRSAHRSTTNTFEPSLEEHVTSCVFTQEGKMSKPGRGGDAQSQACNNQVW